MNTAVYIAKRYLFSRKKMNAINIISGISMLGVFIGSAALVIILSVFNGFEKVILGLYSNFTPELKIEPRLGKTFDPNAAYFTAVHKDPKIFSYTEVLQEKALMVYTNKQFIGTIKGVSANFLKNKQLDSTIQDGSFTLQVGSQQYAVIGGTVAGSLGVNLNDVEPLRLYAPNRNAPQGAINPLDEFVVRSIDPSGVFQIQADFDDIAVVPIAFARDLLNQPVNVTSIEINYKKGTDLDAEQKDVQARVGEQYTVKNRIQQNTELYKTLNYERWFIFMILVFVLIIAIFNIIGSLTMLVIDKKKDIAILSGLGAGKKMVQGIFFFEGMMISGIGCFSGMVLGLIFCLLQSRFQWIKMGDGTSVMPYPVELRVTDFILVFLTVGVIAVIASGISARLSVKELDDLKGDL